MLELLIVLLLVLVNGYFAMSEMAVMTARKSKLKQLSSSSRGAAKAVALSEHPENFLSTVQIGITLIGVLTGVFGGDAIGAAIGAWLQQHLPILGHYALPIGLGVAVTLITYLSLVVGELVPKRIAISNPETIAGHVALPMFYLSRLTAPAVALLALSTRAILRLFGLHKTAANDVSEEEIRILVAESHEQGVIDSDERNMLNRVLRLGDRSAGSLMTPRVRIVWLDAIAPLEDNLAVMREHAFSRYPVFRGSDQDVVGILEVKTLTDQIGNSATPDLFSNLRPALFVSESTHALKLLDIFREEQQTIALVVDEYGDIQGTVSLADLLSAVIGRVQLDDGDDDEPLVSTRHDGSWLVDARLSTDELRELLCLNQLPGEEDHDYHTAAGMVIAHFGRIPHAGERFLWGEWQIEVVDLDGARIDKLLIQRSDSNIASDTTG